MQNNDICAFCGEELGEKSFFLSPTGLCMCDDCVNMLSLYTQAEKIEYDEDDEECKAMFQNVIANVFDNFQSVEDNDAELPYE